MSWEVVLSRIGLSGFDGRGMMAAGLRDAATLFANLGV